jgi:hypothetical protein
MIRPPGQDHNLSVQWTKGDAGSDKVWIPDEYKKKRGPEKTQQESQALLCWARELKPWLTLRGGGRQRGNANICSSHINRILRPFTVAALLLMKACFFCSLVLYLSTILFEILFRLPADDPTKTPPRIPPWHTTLSHKAQNPFYSGEIFLLDKQDWVIFLYVK